MTCPANEKQSRVDVRDQKITFNGDSSPVLKLPFEEPDIVVPSPELKFSLCCAFPS